MWSWKDALPTRLIGSACGIWCITVCPLRPETDIITHCAIHIISCWKETCVYGSSIMRFPMIDILRLKEQNPTTCLTSPAIHFLTNITGDSLRKSTIEVCMFNTFPLKTGKTIILMDSQFSPPQCELIPGVRICFIFTRLKMALSWRRKEAKVTPQKQSPTPTTLMTWRCWRIRLIKQRHYCIVKNEPQQALASMSMHTKRNICVTTKRAILPH